MKLDNGLAGDAALSRDEARHERLLRSFKYPTMNSRRNQIMGPESSTFEWIFERGEDEEVKEDEEEEEDEDKENASNSVIDESDADDIDLDDGNYEIVKAASRCFLQWLQAPGETLFWVSGKPGSGKSTFMKFLTDDTRTLQRLRSNSPNATILWHFIWSAGEELERKIKGFLCSMLFQLAEEDKDGSDAILGNFPRSRSKESPYDWSDRELKEALLLLLCRPSTSYCLFIDGLDEIDPSDGQKNLLGILADLRTISGLTMCVSSRPEPTLRRHLNDLPMFRMQDLTRMDIRKFTSRSLHQALRGSHLGFAKDQYADLVSSLCSMADGVFLWVALALKSILDGLDRLDQFDELKRRLSVIPTDIRDLYKAIWDRAATDKEVYQDDVTVCLNLVLTSIDIDLPLNPMDLRLATDAALTAQIINTLPKPLFSRGEFLDLCNAMTTRANVRGLGLIEANGPSPASPDDVGMVRFIHRSAKEFLESNADAVGFLGRIKCDNREQVIFDVFRAHLLSNYCFTTVAGSHSAHEALDGYVVFERLEKCCTAGFLSRSRVTDIALLLYQIAGALECESFSKPVAIDPGPEISFLGWAAMYSWKEVLQQAIGPATCDDDHTRGLSTPCRSYLLTLALRGPSTVSHERLLETCHWLLSRDKADPNFRVVQRDATDKHFRFHITPLITLTSMLPLWPWDRIRPLLPFLRTLLELGGNLDDTTLFRAWKIDGYGFSLDVQQETGAWITEADFVFIEANLAWSFQVGLWRLVQAGHNEPLLLDIQNFLRTSHTTPRVVRVLAADSVSRSEWRPVLGGLYYDSGNDLDVLSWFASWATYGLEGASASIKSSGESHGQRSFEATNLEDSGGLWNLKDIVKEMNEIGKLTTWEDVEADWLARDLIWREGDPRMVIPKWE